MLQASEDFEQSLEFLRSEFTADIREMKDVFSSRDYNDSWNYIEMELDLLYEKTRVLEDCLAYAQSAITSEIEQRRKKILAVANQIEQYAQSYVHPDYQAIPIVLEKSGRLITDRDGAALAECETGKGLAMPSAIASVCLPTGYVRQGEIEPYRCQPSQLAGQKAYRSYYAMPPQHGQPIRETLRCLFSAPQTINWVTAAPVGCEIESVVAIDETGKELPFAVNTACAAQRVKELQIHLVCRNYSRKKFLEAVRQKNELEFVAQPPKASLEEQEQLLQKYRHQETAAAMLQKSVLWQKDCQAVEAANEQAYAREAGQNS